MGHLDWVQRTVRITSHLGIEKNIWIYLPPFCFIYGFIYNDMHSFINNHSSPECQLTSPSMGMVHPCQLCEAAAWVLDNWSWVFSWSCKISNHGTLLISGWRGVPNESWVLTSGHLGRMRLCVGYTLISRHKRNSAVLVYPQRNFTSTTEAWSSDIILYQIVFYPSPQWNYPGS